MKDCNIFNLNFNLRISQLACSIQHDFRNSGYLSTCQVFKRSLIAVWDSFCDALRR
jgi:hypothetical protein